MRGWVIAGIACVLVIGVLGAVSQGLFASGGGTPVARYNADAKGVMLKGYDPVAYFAPNAVATRGDPNIALERDGVTYFFASQENRDRFAARPEKFTPAYGGYCSYGVSMGQKLDIDPQAFRKRR